MPTRETLTTETITTWRVSPWNPWPLSEILTVSLTHSLTVGWAPHPTVSTISIISSLCCDGYDVLNNVPFLLHRWYVCLFGNVLPRVWQRWIRPGVFLFKWVSSATRPYLVGVFSIPLCQQCRMGSVTDWPLCWQRHTSRKKKKTVDWNVHAGVHLSRAENRAAVFIALQKKASMVRIHKKNEQQENTKEGVEAHCCWFLQRPEVLTCGNSSGTSWSTQRGTKASWNGRTVVRASSSSSSRRQWLRCGVRRRRTAAWPMRNSAVPWGDWVYQVNDLEVVQLFCDWVWSMLKFRFCESSTYPIQQYSNISETLHFSSSAQSYN